jgi:hypothetical protein
MADHSVFSTVGRTPSAQMDADLSTSACWVDADRRASITIERCSPARWPSRQNSSAYFINDGSHSGDYSPPNGVCKKMTKRLIVGISGASGAVLGLRILETLQSVGIESDLAIGGGYNCTRTGVLSKPREISRDNRSQCEGRLCVDSKRIVQDNWDDHCALLNSNALDFSQCQRLLAQTEQGQTPCFVIRASISSISILRRFDRQFLKELIGQ